MNLRNRIKGLEAKLNGKKDSLVIVTRISDMGEESTHVEVDKGPDYFEPGFLRILRPMTPERMRDLVMKLSPGDRRRWKEYCRTQEARQKG